MGKISHMVWSLPLPSIKQMLYIKLGLVLRLALRLRLKLGEAKAEYALFFNLPKRRVAVRPMGTPMELRWGSGGDGNRKSFPMTYIHATHPEVKADLFDSRFKAKPGQTMHKRLEGLSIEIEITGV